MNEYEKCLFDHIIIHKLDSIISRPDYKEISERQNDMEKSLENVITGEQKKLFRRCMETRDEMVAKEMELIFRETLSLAKTIYLGQPAR